MKIIKYAIPLFFILLGFLIYSNVLHGPFLFDDDMYIVNNSQIKDLSNFMKDFSGTRYISYLSFAINYYFGEMDTLGFHFVNICIHIINAILVYYFIILTFEVIKIQRLQTQIQIPHTAIAFAVALIFLVHPIQTQAVSYISQRMASLATLFYLLSLVLYIKARITGQRARGMGQEKKIHVNMPLYILSILSAIFAMKTKEISFTLPFVILLYEWTFPLNKGGQGVVPLLRENNIPLNPPLLRGNNNPLAPPLLRGKSAKRFFYLLPFFLTLIIIPIELFYFKQTDTGQDDIGEWIKQLQLQDIKNVPVYNYFLTQLRVIIAYIRLLFLPTNQVFEYEYTVSKSIFEPATFLSGFLLLFLLTIAIYLYLRSRKTANGDGLIISFGLLWFFITLSVESSVIPIRDMMFEHRVYLPSIGFILVITTLIIYVFDYLENLRLKVSFGGQKLKHLYYYVVSAIVLIAIILSIATYKRNVLWNDKFMMYLDNVNKAPNRAMPLVNLGVAYAERGQWEDAINAYRVSLRIDHGIPEAHNNLGIAYVEKGQFGEAFSEFRAALNLRSNYAEPHYNIGSIYVKQGRIEEAIEEFRTALSFKSDFVDAHFNLGLTYDIKGRTDEAILEFQEVLRINPNDAEARMMIEKVSRQ